MSEIPGPADQTTHATYAEWDAAYVLGVLPAAERRDYEAHLATCERCRAAVAELAGIPGLLGKVPTGEALAETDSIDLTPAPASLMPHLPRPGRARRWAIPLSAAAALLIGAGVGYAVRGADDPAPVSVVAEAGTTRVAFSSVVDVPITAVVDVTPTGEGTRMQVECQYGGSGGGSSTSSSTSPSTASGPPESEEGEGRGYTLVVIDRDGNAVNAATWIARPGRVMHPVAESPLPVSRIAAVEIRGVDGAVSLLRASF